MESLELTHCNKTQRVTIFKIPALSQSKGYYLDDWKQMIWEGGIKVTEKNKVLRVIFIEKNGKVFAQSEIPTDHRQAIKKTQDSSRGYAVRLKKPTGGFLWVGVAFRDRNDAFDFGVVFQEFADRNKMSLNPNALEEQFGEKVDFSLKKGQKIKVNINTKPKKGQNTNADFFNDFNFDEDNKKEPAVKATTKTTTTSGFDDHDWFGDFGNPNSSKDTPAKTGQNNKKPSTTGINNNDNNNLLDF